MTKSKIGAQNTNVPIVIENGPTILRYVQSSFETIFLVIYHWEMVRPFISIMLIPLLSINVLCEVCLKSDIFSGKKSRYRFVLLKYKEIHCTRLIEPNSNCFRIVYSIMYIVWWSINVLLVLVSILFVFR